VSNVRFAKKEEKDGGIKPPLQKMITAFSPARALQAATLPEAEKQAANSTVAQPV